MPGVQQHTLDSVRKAAAEAVEAGVGGLILFGIPRHKDAIGTQADADDGVVQQALRILKSDLGDSIALMADLCLCEYTDHGHCGPLTVDRSTVDNDVTLIEVRVSCPCAGGGWRRCRRTERNDGRTGRA